MTIGYCNKRILYCIVSYTAELQYILLYLTQAIQNNVFDLRICHSPNGNIEHTLLPQTLKWTWLHS